MYRILVATLAALSLASGASAAGKIKLGIFTDLSGPISPSAHEGKRGMDLALEQLGGKLGGLPVELTVVDSKSNPSEAVQVASKLIDEAKVDFVTGFSASNTMIPVWKTFNDAGIFSVGSIAGPDEFAGKGCLPNGFVVSFSNTDWPGAMGKYMRDSGLKRAFFLAPDFQAGYDHLGAAIRQFGGSVIGPVYTPLTQLDFSAELARIRAEKPDGVFAFLFGAAAISFVKQYEQAGLRGKIPLYVEEASANQLTFPAQGDAAVGLISVTNWYAGLDNPANKKFVESFKTKYGREPTSFSAEGYDAINLIDSAVRAVKGKIEDKNAVRAAIKKADFHSVRGNFKFNNNHYPIQTLYIMNVTKNAQGKPQNELKAIAGKDWQDPFHQECAMR